MLKFMDILCLDIWSAQPRLGASLPQAKVKIKTGVPKALEDRVYKALQDLLKE